MTHKNPSLRAASVVKASDAKPAATTGAAAKKPAAQVKKDPVFRLDGKKWAIVRIIARGETSFFHNFIRNIKKRSKGLINLSLIKPTCLNPSTCFAALIRLSSSREESITSLLVRD